MNDNLKYKKQLTIKDLFLGKYGSFFILSIILISSSCVYAYEPFNEIFKYLTIILFVIILVGYIFYLKLNSFVCLFTIYFLLLVFSTIYNNLSLVTVFHTYYKTISLILYLDMALRYNCKNVIKNLCYILSLLVFLNFITIILFPNGMFQGNYNSLYWFLGYKNIHILYFLPLIICNIIHNKFRKKKISLLFIFNLLMINFELLYCFSANSLVTFFIFELYLLFPFIYNKFQLTNARRNYLLYFISFILIVLIRIQNIFGWFIEQILHKSLTFTGRTFIWDISMTYINSKKILGYGVEETEIIANKFGNIAFTHCHNTILDLTYKGGIISLIIFSIFLYLIVKKLYKTRHYKISKTLSVALLGIFLMMLFEARQASLGFYIIFIICYHIDIIINKLKEGHIEEKNI